MAYCGLCGARLHNQHDICPECGADMAGARIVDLTNSEQREGKARILAVGIVILGLSLAYLEPVVFRLAADVEQELADGIAALTFLLTILVYVRRSNPARSTEDEKYFG